MCGACMWCGARAVHNAPCTHYMCPPLDVMRHVQRTPRAFWAGRNTHALARARTRTDTRHTNTYSRTQTGLTGQDCSSRGWQQQRQQSVALISCGLTSLAAPPPSSPRKRAPCCSWDPASHPSVHTPILRAHSSIYSGKRTQAKGTCAARAPHPACSHIASQIRPYTSCAHILATPRARTLCCLVCRKPLRRPSSSLGLMLSKPSKRPASSRFSLGLVCCCCCCCGRLPLLPVACLLRDGVLRLGPCAAAFAAAAAPAAGAAGGTGAVWAGTGPAAAGAVCASAGAAAKAVPL